MAVKRSRCGWIAGSALFSIALARGKLFRVTGPILVGRLFRRYMSSEALNIGLESLLLALILAAALMPLAAALVPGLQRTAVPKRLALGAVLAVVIGGWASFSQRPEPSEKTVTDRPVRRTVGEYVTSDTCRACHPREYATWHASYHRTMTQVADESSVVGDFGDVTLEYQSSTFRVYHAEGEYWVDITRPGETQSKQFRVVMTTGSHHRQFYWHETDNGRTIQELPFIWQIDEGRWIPFTAAILIDPRAPGEAPPGHWNTTCIRCHATAGHMEAIGTREAVESFDSYVAEFGIACESCHGPAEEHIRANRDPIRRLALHGSDEADETIANPARMSRRRSSQVCGQCHADLRFRSDDDFQHWIDNGVAYRPGDDLEATRFLARPMLEPDAPILEVMHAENPHYLSGVFWPDGMARVTGSEYNGMIQSPCYAQAADEEDVISCLDCHAMHQAESDERPRSEWTNDQLQPGMWGNRACGQCHEGMSSEDALIAHTHHAADSSGSQCYNCHMPHTAYGLYTAVRSHQISTPSVAVSLDSGRPDACNLCHLDQTLGWTASYLEAWYGVPSPELRDDERQVAASVLWLVRGNAAQRALVAWSMGWEPAREASGTEWMAPYLGIGMEDPYPAVRLLAYRGLQKTKGFEGEWYDFLQPQEGTSRVVYQKWRQVTGPPPRAALLLGPGGEFDMEEMNRLYRERDNSSIFIRE